MEISQPNTPSFGPATGTKSAPRTPKPASSSQPEPKTKSIPTPNHRRALTVEPTTPTAPTMPTKLQALAQELQSCSWVELQDRFADAMHERAEFESALQKETAELLEVFIVWSQTTGFHDEDRAYKRFKTRMDYVQNYEASLEEKKKHYANVVKAFESALALLRDE